jgi:hypothetical protein
MANQTPASVPLLHRFLGLGMVLLGVAFGIAKFSGIAPGIQSPDGTMETIGYVLTGISLATAIVAFAFLKPQVPERKPGQTVEQYWTTIDVAMKATRFWFALEGGGVIAAVAYFLTGLTAAALAFALLTALFWIAGPNMFAKP